MLKPLPNNKGYYPKDFIETAEGLMFAVVEYGVEQTKDGDVVLCFLRYVKAERGQKQPWQKLSTDQANAFLQTNHPGYLHYSDIIDAHLHAVPVNNISVHHAPKRRLQALLKQQALAAVELDCVNLCLLFQQHGINLDLVGVTGSLLVNVQNANSDIDFVCYERTQFHKLRSVIKALIDDNLLSQLSDKDWREAFARRSCSLTYAEYLWHEQRKYNKAMIKGRKFDISFVAQGKQVKSIQYHKLGNIKAQCKVLDAQYAFDYPAVFIIDHPEASAIVCYTATYNGQAQDGELIEVSGLLEQGNDGKRRIIVGSSREATSEYIKVVQSCPP